MVKAGSRDCARELSVEPSTHHIRELAQHANTRRSRVRTWVKHGAGGRRRQQRHLLRGHPAGPHACPQRSTCKQAMLFEGIFHLTQGLHDASERPSPGITTRFLGREHPSTRTPAPDHA